MGAAVSILWLIFCLLLLLALVLHLIGDDFWVVVVCVAIAVGVVCATGAILYAFGRVAWQ